MTCNFCHHAEVPQIHFEFHEGNDKDLCFSETTITVCIDTICKGWNNGRRSNDSYLERIYLQVRRSFKLVDHSNYFVVMGHLITDSIAIHE